MKKIFILLFVSILSYSVNAQSKSEDAVKQQTDKMTEVIKLTEAEKSQVYKILLEKELKIVALRKEYKTDPETKKVEIKKLHPVYNKQMKAILGKERMSTYNAYKKGQKKKK